MKNGRLVLPASLIASTEAIKEMIDNPMRAGKLGKAAREKVKKEFWDIFLISGLIERQKNG